MRRIRFALLIVLLLPLCAQAQQFPFYSQYIYNPYVINPAFVAVGRAFEVNATYRRQWANIEDGPKTLQVDAQYPLTSRVAMGFNIFEDRTVMLSSTTAMVTYGYKVPLATGHVLGFGLSGGVVSNRIRTDEISTLDTSDPALANATNNNMAIDGNFGMYYNFKNFYLGFSMVRLFDNTVITEDSFQEIKLSKLENKIAYASYRFSFANDTWAFQPNFMYRFATANINFYEATAIISYNNMVDVGGGIREGFGPILTGRLRIKNLEAGFAYDFPSALPQVSTGGTYEVQLKYKFGKRVDAPAKRPKPELVAQVTPDPPKEEPKKEEPKKEEPKVEPKEEPKKEEPKVETKVETVVQEPVRQEPVVQQPVVQQTEAPKEEVQPPAPGGYYLVIGAFRIREHANSFLKSVTGLGYKAVLKKGNDLYYVHLPEHHKADAADHDQVNKIRATTQFKDAWYTTIEE